MATDPKILETIRKLAELANPERGGTANETAVAAAKMAQLMEKYNVQWAEVLLTQSEQERTHEFIRSDCKNAFGSMKAWQWSLARSISKITLTKFFSTSAYGAASYRDGTILKNRSSARMCFFGGKEQSQLACDLFDEWAEKIDLMARKATGEYCHDLTETYGIKNPIQNFGAVKMASDGELDDDDHPVVWRTSWLMGVVNGIANALYEEEKARKEQEAKEAAEHNVSTALMVITTALENAYTEYSVGFRKVRGGGSGRSNYGAYSKGKAVGATIKIGSKKLGGG